MRPGAALLAAAAVFSLNVILPPVVLSLARKPWTYFAFNPWLKSLPEFVTSSRPLSEKLDFLSRVALFWFSADGDYGAPEWGFAVDTMDLLRFLAMSVLVGLFVALWLERRRAGSGTGWRLAAGRHGGILGGVVGVLGFSTGPCSVMGCGAPVLPVLALVFAGLSSSTLSLLSGLSRVAGIAVLAGLTMGVLWLGYQVGARTAQR